MKIIPRRHTPGEIIAKEKLSHMKDFSRHTIIVFNDLPRMSTENMNSVIEFYQSFLPYDICIISGNDERYEDDFQHSVNYVDWKYDVPKEYLEKNRLIQIWKHWQTCQILPKKYKFIIRVRSDLKIPKDVSNSYWHNLFEFSCHGDIVLGFGFLSSGKLFRNFFRKIDGNSVEFMSDFIICHKRKLVRNPTENIWNKIYKNNSKSDNISVHTAWTHFFADSNRIENVIFPVHKIVADRSQYKRLE
jgi:hypothetical protein